MIDNSIRYMDGGGVAVPQKGGSTEMSGALGKLIAQNPEILEVLKKGSPQTPGVDESKPPAYDEFLEYQASRPDDMFRAAPAVVTPVEYEGVTYNFGNPLQAEDYLNFMENRRQDQIVSRPLPEAPTNYPISPPAMPDLQDFEVIPGNSILDMAPDAGTLIRLADGTEMRVGFFGEHSPLQQAYFNALQERRAAATPTPMPTPTPTPTPMPVNPFQRPEAPSAPMPQPVNQYSAPPVMQTGPSMTPITDFSFYQAPQQEIALTPAEVLARARNPFNRPS
jgi:hypothetical protein